MSVKQRIKQILKEIEVYNSHALFSPAKQKCRELMALIENADQIVHKDTLLLAITRKIESIEEEARNFEGIGKATTMSNRELDVVKQLVVPQEADSNEAIWEVAQACLILGQYASALREFNRLIDNRFKQVAAAKNVLLCHIGMSAIDEAINQYKEWALSGLFSLEQMENIRSFLQELLYKNKIDRLITTSRINRLTTTSMIENIDHQEESPDEEFIDVIAVKLTMEGDPDTSQETMFDVHYQRGSIFSVVVPKENQALLDYLKVGKEIAALELYSSSIIFTDRCLVCEKSKIISGPRNGDYSVCLKILDSDHNT